MRRKKISKTPNCLFGMIFLIFYVLISLSGSNLHAEPIGKNMAMVVSKAPNCIVITDYKFNISSNHVLVTPSSSIMDIDGKRILLKDLRIPCIAKLRLHQTRKSIDPELIWLKVKEYDKTASSDFTMKEPFKRLPE